MKFLDKFRNKYSFNFLGICGWVVCILFFKVFFPYRNEAQISFPLTFIFLFIVLFSTFCLSLSIIILVLEEIFYWQIKNQKFLNNKFILIFQTLGSIFAILPIVYFLFIFFG